MLTNMIERLAEEVSPVLPENGLSDAVRAFVETCEVQLDWSFRETTDCTHEPAPTACRGSTLALTSETGTWVLIALCDEVSSQKLTRLLFAMDEDEDVTLEDMADAMNEILNVAAGVFKTRRTPKGEQLTIGLPTFLDGDEAIMHLSDQVETMTRTISTEDDVCMKIFAFWQDGGTQ